MVDTDSRPLVIQAHPADIQDRDGAAPLVKVCGPVPFVAVASADGAYDADRVKDATPITIDIVKKIAHQVGFQVLPRRWAVERTFAWLNRNRRLAKDLGTTIDSAATSSTPPTTCSR